MLNRRQWLTGSTSVAFSQSIQSSSMGQQPAPSQPKNTVQYPTHRETFALAEAGKKIPVIFDTDIGSDIDDTWALLYLLRCPELQPLLVACDAGQGLYRARLAAKFLTQCDRDDVPVAIGDGDRDATGNQIDWVGNFRLDNYAGTVHEDAVEAIIQVIHGSEVPVTLVCVGAVPNIAAALRRDPSICENARFVGMHGAIRKGYGDSETPVPEANVRTNPAALRSVFAAPWQCSVTPLDTCGIVSLSGERYQRVQDANFAATEALMANYRAWLQRVTWLKVKPDPAVRSSTLFDVVAVYMAFSETWLNMETLPIAVDEKGMTLVEDGAPMVRCATSWNNLSDFLDHLVKRLSGE